MSNSALESIQKISKDCIRLFDVSKSIVSYRKNYPALIRERVGDLLSQPKPRLMVCGVYSAGKSTLVNVLCRREVAAVGAQPKTDKVTSYDECCDYILVDSPGVDAPIEHEQITDDYVKRSHALMFVISTKNAESEANYRKIQEWMKYKKPLLVVLNDKIGSVDLDGGEVDQVRLKVAENFRRIGFDRTNDYEIVAVNAQMAWQALHMPDGKKRSILFSNSNIPQLEALLRKSMKEGCAIYLAPMEELRRVLDDMENELIALATNNDAKELQGQLELIEREGVRIASSIKHQVKKSCQEGKVRLIDACMDNTSQDELDNVVASVSKRIATSIDDNFRAQVGRLAEVVNANLRDYGIKMSPQGRIELGGVGVDFTDMVNNASGNLGGNFGNGGSPFGDVLKGATAGSALALSLPAVLGTIGGGLGTALAGLPLGPIGIIGGAIVGLFCGSRRRNEQREAYLEHMREENRRRQEAIEAHYRKVQAEIGAKMEEAETTYSSYATELFSKAIAELKETISRKIAAGKEYNERIASFRREVSGLKAELDGIRNGIM